jgi:hypothetical protein
MVLTSAGLAEGFKLTTFASGFTAVDSGTPGFPYGPFGMGFTSTGGVLVSDIQGDVLRFLTDADGQDARSVPVAANYGSLNPGDIGMSAGKFYLALTERVDQINSDGTFNHLIVNLVGGGGIATNPLNGHLFVSSEDPAHLQVLDVDPVAKTVKPFVDTTLIPDGLAFSANGSILYVSTLNGFSAGRVLGFDTTTKAQVFDSGVISDGPDGLALGVGVLAGKLYDNTNGGRVVEIDLATLTQTVIATGGSRGDFVRVDPNNGSLLLVQSDSILRLTAPAAGGFDPGGTVPEPSSLVLGCLAIITLSLFACARRRLRCCLSVPS